MFTIGQTSGVASCSAPEGEPVTTIKNYLTKMAKAACDLPCPHVAATKVVEVSQGKFSGGSVLKSATFSVDSGGGGSGCCGGSSCSGKGGCCGKSCTGKNATSPSNPSQPAASGCSGANAQASGTSGCRGGTSRDGSTTGNIPGISTNNSAYSNGVTGSNDTVTPGAGTTNSQTGATTSVALDANGNPVVVVTAAADDTETADVINFAVEHTIEQVRLMTTGIIPRATDPIYEASKWSNPDPTTPKIDPTVIVPSLPIDILTSSYPQQVDNQVALAEEFDRTMCARRPFPECDACIFASQLIEMTATDLYDLLYGIQIGLDAISKGNCEWGERMFMCPGQIAALLKQEFGPVGAVVGSAVAGVMIAATAVHGALTAYGNIVEEFIDTDFRCCLRDSAGSAIRSGGCPNSFNTIISGVLRDLGIPAHDLFTGAPTGYPVVGRPNMRTSPGTPHLGSYNNPAYLGGAAAFQLASRLPIDGLVSPETKKKVGAVAAAVSGLMGSAALIASNPVAQSLLAPGMCRPTSQCRPRIPTRDQRACPGVTYYYKKPSTTSPTAWSYAKVPAKECTPGTKLDSVRAKYGPQIFVDEKDTLAANPAKAKEILKQENLAADFDKLNPDSIVAPVGTGGTGNMIDGSTPVDESTGSSLTGIATIPKDGRTSPAGDPKTYKEAASLDPDTMDKSVRDSATMPEIRLDSDGNPDFSDGAASIPKNTSTPTTGTAYTKTNDKIIDRDKTYYVQKLKDPTDPDAGTEMVALTPEEMSLLADKQIEDFVKTTDTEADPDKVYFKKSSDMPPVVYIEVEDTEGKNPAEEGWLELNDLVLFEGSPREELEERETLPVSGPLVFDNGLMLEPVVSTDAKDYAEMVNTPSLVTDSHIPVASMAKLYGIGLTSDELKVAYALDHELNGSVMPVDCKAVRIPTILDTLTDDEYD